MKTEKYCGTCGRKLPKRAWRRDEARQFICATCIKKAKSNA